MTHERDIPPGAVASMIVAMIRSDIVTAVRTPPPHVAPTWVRAAHVKSPVEWRTGDKFVMAVRLDLALFTASQRQQVIFLYGECLTDTRKDGRFKARLFDSRFFRPSRTVPSVHCTWPVYELTDEEFERARRDGWPRRVRFTRPLIVIPKTEWTKKHAC